LRATVEIHLELMTAAQRLIIALQLLSVALPMALRFNSLSLRKKFSTRSGHVGGADGLRPNVRGLVNW
jgi:hypothetical protein